MASSVSAHGARMRSVPKTRRTAMGRQKSDILSGIGTAFELVRALRDAGATDDDLRAILAKDSSLPQQVVDLLKGVASNVLERMIAACHFDRVNGNITQSNFPTASEPAEDAEYELVCLERLASTDEAEAEIKRLGMESATLGDLLLYVRRNPEEQRKYPVVALGSRWQLSYGVWYSPYADDWFGRRRLNLRWRVSGWDGSFRFLARKRKPETRVSGS